MNFYVKINGEQYPVIKYSYRLNNVDSDTKISHLFSCVVVAENAVIAVGQTIEFYSDDVLIYTDPINSVIQNGAQFTIQSNKTVNIPVSKANAIDTVFYYSSVTLRTALNFNIMPLDSLVVNVGNFTAYTIVHYNFTTEVAIG